MDIDENGPRLISGDVVGMVKKTVKVTLRLLQSRTKCRLVSTWNTKN